MEHNMKIYEIGTGYTPIPAQISAATEIIVEELTKAFIKQNILVEIIDIAADDRVATQLPIMEVPVPRLLFDTDIHLGIMHKLKRVIYSVALAGVLKKLLKKEKEKVVLHFHNQYNLFFFLKLTPASLRKKAIIAYTNHSGVWRLAWDEIKDTIAKRYFQEAECMKCADLVFVLNEETKQNVMEHLGVEDDHIVIINNGVNTDVYRPLTDDERAAAKEKIGLQNCKVILQVGSVYENKGQLRSAEDLLPLLKENKDLVFAYVGGIVDEEYQRQITAFTQENGLAEQIRYLGMISPGKELNALYNTASATILPSRYEAFGLVAIESLSAGVPVLTDERGPIRFGAGNVCFSPDNVRACVEQLIYSADNQLRVDARNNALNQYSWNKIAADYMVALMQKEKMI